MRRRDHVVLRRLSRACGANKKGGKRRPSCRHA
jgi:hypothetical protein